jgi:ClpP class serine protease
MPRNRHPITGCRFDTLLDPVWLIDPAWLEAAMSDPRAQDLTVVLKMNEDRADEEPDPPYVVKDHVALMPIQGPLTKYPTSFQALFGGSDYTTIRKTYRDLAKDDDVRIVVQQIESPGGSAEGLPEAITDLEKLVGVKKVINHFTDKGTSAAYALGIHATECVGNKLARVANIGTIAKIVDTSRLEEMKGKRVIPIVPDGFDFKSLGMDGIKITDDQINELKRQVGYYNDHFVGWVSNKRGITPQQIKDLKARVYMGQDAVDRKLIDKVESFDDTMDRALSEAKQKTTVTVPAVPPPNNPGVVAGQLPVQRSTRMALTAEQISKLHGAGVKDVTVENGDQKAYEAWQNAMGLVSQRDATIGQKDIELASMKQAPRQGTTVDPVVLQERHDLMVERIDALAAQNCVTGEQATKFKSMMKSTDGKINAMMLTPNADGKTPMALMLDALKINKPNGLSGQQTQGQPVLNPGTSTPPGAGDEFKRTADQVVSNQMGQWYDHRDPNTAFPSRAHQQQGGNGQQR